MEFQDKVALVTGAGTGIGEAIAERLYVGGCSVVLVSRHLAAVESVCQRIDPKGTQTLSFEAKLPHRLDFGTSGVMVVALTQQATQHLNHQFQVGAVQKRYVAVLEGWVSEDEGNISAPIAKDKSQFPRVKICSSTGKAATSHFRVVDRLTQPRRTLVEFTPVTGRTHQLRIHSLFMGHPILGCDLYQNATSQQLAARLLLHASDLHFQHPVSGEPCHGHCSSPFIENTV